MLRSTAVRLLLATALAAGAAAQTAAPTSELAARLQAAFATLGADYWGVVQCGQDGKVVFAGAQGMQDRVQRPLDQRSLFDLGALGDRITAIAALQWLQQKRWSVDDPIARGLPGWPADKQGITWRHLLQHTSGLPATADWTATATAARRPAIAAIAAVRLIDVPGRGSHWSLLNGNLLALLVEHGSGRPFQEWVHKRVFAPAAMTTAGFLDDRFDAAHLTTRLQAGGKTEPASQFAWDWSQRGARGVLASGNDLTALALALGANKLLPERARQDLLAPLPLGDVLRVQSVVRGGVEWTQLHGAVTGYRARLLLAPSARAWIALLADERDLDAAETALAVALAPALAVTGAAPATSPLVPRTAPAPQPAGGSDPMPRPAAVARFLGVFELEDGNRFEVVRDGDGVLVSGLGVQASARLQHGQWPLAELGQALQKAEDRALAALRPLVAGAGPVVAAHWSGDSALTSARQCLDRLGQRLGGPCELQFVGTETTGAHPSWLRVRGRNGAAFVRVSWSTRGAITALAESREPPPFRARFALLRGDWAVATIGGAEVTLSVEGIGAGRTLVLEDRGGLCAARWVGDVREG